jgi:hypothetical protein
MKKCPAQRMLLSCKVLKQDHVKLLKSEDLPLLIIYIDVTCQDFENCPDYQKHKKIVSNFHS